MTARAKWIKMLNVRVISFSSNSKTVCTYFAKCAKHRLIEPRSGCFSNIPNPSVIRSRIKQNRWQSLSLSITFFVFLITFFLVSFIFKKYFFISTLYFLIRGLQISNVFSTREVEKCCKRTYIVFAYEHVHVDTNKYLKYNFLIK